MSTDMEQYLEKDLKKNMEKILYLECYSGISGDMTVAALLSLGADEEKLREALDSLPLTGYEIVISDVVKSGIVMKDFNVVLDAEHENHDHDMEYLYGHNHEHSHEEHEHCHEHEHNHEEHEHCHNHEHSHEEHEHCHDHEHSHEEHEHCHDHEHIHEEHCHAGTVHETHTHSHSHHHTHRGLPEINQILEAGNLTPEALAMAKKIFLIVAKAEAKVHGRALDEVHFHEVGAVDSIVDIAAIAVCLDLLKYDQVVVSPLYEGRGSVRCQHGILPIPVPAVSAIAASEGITLHLTNVNGELVTPTGAAVAAAIRTMDALPESYQVEAVGMGAGKRNYPDAPGFLRAMTLYADRKTDENTDRIWKLESNIDDSTGEQLGYLMDLLMKQGARDVNYSPVYMKKNRPAYQLNVICDDAHRELLEHTIFQESSTIGIRRMEMERTVLSRKQLQVETCYGTAGVKVCYKDDICKAYPEYEDARKLAEAAGIPLRDVYEEIIRKAREM